LSCTSSLVHGSSSFSKALHSFIYIS
jgi:hypothetical protein